MRTWAQRIGMAGIIAFAAASSGTAGTFSIASEPVAPETEKVTEDLRTKIAKMPGKARLAMSSVVGWSPIYDVEKISLRQKDVYRVTFDHQGHPAQVHIDDQGEVLDDPAVT